MVKTEPEMSGMEKRTIILARLVPTPEAYEGKSNSQIEKEILAEKPLIPYGAEVKRIVVLDSPTQIGDTGTFKEAVIEAFKPIRRALGPALKHLANKGVEAKTIFNAEKGYHIIVCYPAKREP